MAFLNNLFSKWPMKKHSSSATPPDASGSSDPNGGATGGGEERTKSVDETTANPPTHRSPSSSPSNGAASGGGSASGGSGGGGGGFQSALQRALFKRSSGRFSRHRNRSPPQLSPETDVMPKARTSQPVDLNLAEPARDPLLAYLSTRAESRRKKGDDVFPMPLRRTRLPVRGNKSLDTAVKGRRKSRKIKTASAGTKDVSVDTDTITSTAGEESHKPTASPAAENESDPEPSTDELGILHEEDVLKLIDDLRAGDRVRVELKHDPWLPLDELVERGKKFYSDEHARVNTALTYEKFAKYEFPSEEERPLSKFSNVTIMPDIKRHTFDIETRKPLGDDVVPVVDHGPNSKNHPDHPESPSPAPE